MTLRRFFHCADLKIVNCTSLNYREPVTWARVAVVIYDVWKQTTDARSLFALDENIVVICVPANRAKIPGVPSARKWRLAATRVGLLSTAQTAILQARSTWRGVSYSAFCTNRRDRV
jgi:hypothetical protein